MGNVENIEVLFNKFIDKKYIYEAAFMVESGDKSISYNNSYGKKGLDTPLILASITKLFTSTCIFILEELGLLCLEDKLIKYLDSEVMDKIHIYKNKDYSKDITIYDLICHSSGLPDIFEEKKNSVKENAITKDIGLALQDKIDLTKQLKPHFKPNSKNKAYYSDINFDLLGMIIEKVTSLSLDKTYKKYIFEPLNLKNTYLPVKESDFIPEIYYKNKSIYRPKTIISSYASGGCVSTINDMMIFIKAFFNKKLFNKELLNNKVVYRKLQISMGITYYGLGYMKIPLKSIFTLFQGEGELIGHSGTTGSFAFYYPSKDLFFVGNFNQMSDPSIPIRFSMKLAMNLK